MALRSTQLRIILRWVHIVLSLVIMCFVYSPWGVSPVFRKVIQFGVIPVLTFTGLWIWKFPAFNKFFKIR